MLSEEYLKDGDSASEAVAGPGIEFSMVVLCYRAGESIVPFIERIHRTMSLFSFDWELVLVANFWPKMEDPTPSVTRRLAERLDRVRVIAEPKEGHMGWDVKKGLDACRGRIIGFIDGDGQFPVEIIAACLAKIENGGCDFIKTYRVIREDGVWRRFISMMYNLIFKILFPRFRGLHDVNSKPKIMKRTAYERMNLHSTDWFMDAEIMLNALEQNLEICELPVHFKSLGERDSFIKPSAIIEFIRNLLAYRFSRHRKSK